MASVKFTNPAGAYNSFESQILRLLQGKEPIIAAIANQARDKAYSGAFSRDPNDTGDAKRRTITRTSINKKNSTLEVVFEIIPSPSSARVWSKGSVIDYAIFFIAPLQPRNPNYKYGERNTVRWARDETARVLGINKITK
jgi:hypothetical protein